MKQEDKDRFMSTTEDGDWWCKACQWTGKEAEIDFEDLRMHCPECGTVVGASIIEAARELHNR